MRGIQAKKIRRIIFGDKNLKAREYQVHTFKYITHRVIYKDNIIEYHPKTITAMGERRDYQILKSVYKRMKKTNE